MRKNTWKHEDVLFGLTEFYKDIKPRLSKDTVFVFSIGSFVRDTAEQTTIQMHPFFADELAEKLACVHVYNFDNSFTYEPKLEPVLQRASVHYVNVELHDIPEHRRLISDIFNAGGKIILIDNVGKLMTDFTRAIAREHRKKIHHQLEVLHRYICVEDGVAVLYHETAFEGSDEAVMNNIGRAMRIANGGDLYAEAGKHREIRARYIQSPGAYQESIKDLALFFASGLVDIKAEHLFNPHLNKKPMLMGENRQTDQDIKPWQKNLKLFLFIVAVIITFPISLPLLAIYYYHCKKNNKPFRPQSLFDRNKNNNVRDDVSLGRVTVGVK